MELVSMISLIAAGVISGLVLIIGVIYFCILRGERAQVRPMIPQEGSLTGLQFERTEGGAWPTSHSDGAHH